MITINYAKKAIEISKDYAKKSAIYGSNEYNELKNAKADFPTFRVSVKTAPKRKFEDKLTMKDMATYIREHSGAESAEMKTFAELRGVPVKYAANVFETVESAKFSDIKKWFFLTYSELSKKTEIRRSRIDEILEEAAKRAEAANENNAASA